MVRAFALSDRFDSRSPQSTPDKILFRQTLQDDVPAMSQTAHTSPGKHLDTPSMAELHSAKSTRRLKQIAHLRSIGLGDVIDLPQLIVAGDQSAGKSSVLEGITGIPFPRQDGVCTRFPTEIIMEDILETPSIIATIIPASTRDDVAKSRLSAFRHHLPSIKSLPTTIAEAGELMGVKGFGKNTTGPSFSEDILRVHVSGQTGLHLSIVDLPGIFTVASEVQTEDDVRTVRNMVDNFAASSRTIILAVVQSGNDIANQTIIQRARIFDPEGERTVGVLTKPDLINAGTEARLALLAKNQDTTKLRLGYFLLKNPTPVEMARGITADERSRNELRFFQSPPWKGQGLSTDRIGIGALKTYLQTLLDSHIEKELPKVRAEIKKMLADRRHELHGLGEARETVGQMRMFLSRLSTEFHALVLAALKGDYQEVDHEFFSHNDGESISSRRLRACTDLRNSEFADDLHDNGQRRKMRKLDNGSGQAMGQALDKVRHRKTPYSHDTDLQQVEVTKQQMLDWIKNVYVNTKGKELPGNYSSVLLAELFHEQSSRWLEIAQRHVDWVYEKIYTFMVDGLLYIIKEESMYLDVLEFVEDKLKQMKSAAEEELLLIWDDEQSHPMTYNHYYTDNIQEARNDATRELINAAIKSATGLELDKKTSADSFPTSFPQVGAVPASEQKNTSQFPTGSNPFSGLWDSNGKSVSNGTSGAKAASPFASTPTSVQARPTQPSRSAPQFTPAPQPNPVPQSSIVQATPASLFASQSTTFAATSGNYSWLPTGPNGLLDVQRLGYTLQKSITVDMEDYACGEAMQALNAYTKVALKTFVDNVCRQVIERHLLRKLPDVFCPNTVAGYSDEELRQVAGESTKTAQDRQNLKQLCEALEAGLRELRK